MPRESILDRRGERAKRPIKRPLNAGWNIGELIEKIEAEENLLKKVMGRRKGNRTQRD